MYVQRTVSCRPSQLILPCPLFHLTLLQFESLIKGAGAGLSCLLHDPRGMCAHTTCFASAARPACACRVFEVLPVYCLCTACVLPVPYDVRYSTLLIVCCCCCCCSQGCCGLGTALYTVTQLCTTDNLVCRAAASHCLISPAVAATAAAAAAAAAHRAVVGWVQQWCCCCVPHPQGSSSSRAHVCG
jgi:hypothetical protein